MGVKNRYLALVAAGERPYGTFRARDKGLGVAQQLVRFTAGHLREAAELPPHAASRPRP